MRLKNYNILKVLSKKCKVDLYIHSTEELSKRAEVELSKFSHNIYFERINFTRAVANALLGCLFFKPLQVSMYTSNNTKKKLEDNSKNYDAILFALVRTITTRIEGVKCFLDMADVLSETFRQKFYSEKNIIKKLIFLYEAKTLKILEKKAFSMFEKVFLFNRLEVNRLTEKYSNVKLIHHGTEFSRIRINVEKRKKDRLIGIIGNFSYKPNSDLTKKMIGYLLKQDSFKLVVIGADVPNWMKNIACKNPRLKLTGFVEDIYDEINKCFVTLAPVSVGGGIQNKILNSLACGVPVITNKKGSEAFEIGVKGMFLVKSEDEILTKVVEIFNSEDYEKISNVSSKVTEIYSWPKCIDEYYSEMYYEKNITY